MKKEKFKLLKNILLLISTLIPTIAFTQSFTNFESHDFLAHQKLVNKSTSWYNSRDAINVATNILLCQRNTGGWAKGKNYFDSYSPEEKIKISNEKNRKDCTWDNNATYPELIFLARLYSATSDEKYKDAFNRGIDLILEAQYANGGWPQFYPDYNTRWSWDNSHWNHDGLERFITYSDDAMTGLMILLKSVSEGKNEFGFIDNIRREKARVAVNKGIECILKSQYYDNGRLTAWPAQVDEITYEPKWGRSFEPPAVASQESVGVIRFLMSIDHPGAEIIHSVQSAVKWLNDVKILNTTLEYSDTMTVIKHYGRYTNGHPHGRRDITVKYSPGAPPIWSRFYELHTERPVFASRNDSVSYKISEISLERRTGTGWYGYVPQRLIEEDYPKWCDKNKLQRIF